MNYFAESPLWLKQKTDSRPAINSSLQFFHLFPLYLFINITYKKKKES